jgi:sterol desaturase/sphingolipid hydroxylase (fatty acid hydroxylase superfamily)
MSLVSFLPWPLSTFVGLALTPPPAADAAPASKRYGAGPVLSSPLAHASIVVSAAWKVALAALVYHASYLPAQRAAASAAALEPRWLAGIAARNVLLTWAVGAGWDWLHLSPSSPLYARLQPLKFSGVPARGARVAQDAAWATLSALVAAAWEVLIAHARARGWLAPVPAGDAWWTHAPTLAALLALPYLQIVHFYVIHRMMHRWFPRGSRPSSRCWLPDVGAWLYRNVHYIHHRARDPTAFSGIAMHPVESAIFFTTMPIAALLGAHPIVVLHCSFYNIVVAMVGHESYGDPSTGGFDHYIHHRCVDCNFGGTFVPIDWLCGTAVRDEDEFAARFGAPPGEKT